MTMEKKIKIIAPAILFIALLVLLVCLLISMRSDISEDDTPKESQSVDIEVSEFTDSLVDGKVLGITLVSQEELETKVSTDSLLSPQYNISFNGNPIVYDIHKEIVYIPQNMNEFCWSGELSSDSGELFFLHSGELTDKQQAIKNNTVFQLYHVDEGGYCIYNIIFTGMPIMSIASGEITEEDDNQVVLISMEICDPYSTEQMFLSETGYIRKRGATSYGFPKTNYRLELDNKQSLLGMRRDDDWVLNSLYDDSGLVHNKLSYAIWNDIASYNNVENDNGVSMEYVEVFLDNQYMGVYGLLERMDKKTFSLEESDKLYKCISWDYPTSEEYLFTDLSGYELKYPESELASIDDWKPLMDMIDAFCRGEFDTIDELYELINLENAIDFNLFCVLTAAVDNTRKNSYFIAKYNYDSSYSLVEVPWDLNGTWGNRWSADYDTRLLEMTDMTTWSTVIRVLFEHDEDRIAQMLKERWKELRENNVISKEKTLDMLNAEYDYLYDSGAYTRDKEQWPNANGCVFASYQWLEEYIYQYIEFKFDYLDQYFENPYYIVTN